MIDIKKALRDNEISNDEIWKPVVNYENIYEISNFGHLKRIKPGPGAQVGRILRPSLDRDGYPKVVLYNDGARKNRSIHSLVTRAFLGEPKNKQEVNHKDGSKLNNSISNLEYVSSSENKIHAQQNGLRKSRKGELNSQAKISSQTAKIIRELCETGQSCDQLAEQFQLSRSQIYRIKDKSNWKDD